MKRLLCLLTTVTFFLTSCKTDIDIAGPWENLPVVYSILDPNDSIHYVRINRVFSGNESAYTMANHSDSLIYDSDLSVKVFVKNKKDVLIKTLDFTKLYLTKDSLNAQGEAVFSRDKHHVYANSQTLPYTENQDSLHYELEIILPDGKKITSISHPLVGLWQKSPRIGEQYNLEASKMISSTFLPPKYSGGAKLNIYFHYYEWYSEDNYKRKTLLFPIKMQKINSNREESIGIKGVDIFNRLKEVLDPPASGMIRYPGKIDFEYVIADENFAEHIWKRNSGLSSETPPITNIKGGYGLFACRSYVINRGFKPSTATLKAFDKDNELQNLFGFGKSATYYTNKIHLLP